MSLIALAQAASEEQVAKFALMGFAGVICCSVAVGVAIQVFICYLLFTCFKRIPPEYRKQEPGLVWLLLIPIFNLVWNFFVYPKLSQSYQAYFAAQGRTDVGDAGYGIALALCICVAVSWIPYAGVLTAIAALVLLIIFLIKAVGLRNQIPDSTLGADTTIR